VTTPTAALYADVSDLRLVLDSTDAGTGTAAQLPDDQLTLALQEASDRVSLYTGSVYDPASVPSIIRSLTLDLAAWWAWTYYSKSKEMGPNHPVVLRYTEAKNVLESIRKGEISIDVGGVEAAATAHVINTIPNIFSPEDSNTRYDRSTGYLAVDTPPDSGPGRRSLLDQWGPY